MTMLTITCRACSTVVEFPLEEYVKHDRVLCSCGSADLLVVQPPSTREEKAVAIRRLMRSCRGGCTDGAIEVRPGEWRLCGVCGGAGSP